MWALLLFSSEEEVSPVRAVGVLRWSPLRYALAPELDGNSGEKYTTRRGMIGDIDVEQIPVSRTITAVQTFVVESACIEFQFVCFQHSWRDKSAPIATKRASNLARNSVCLLVYYSSRPWWRVQKGCEDKKWVDSAEVH